MRNLFGNLMIVDGKVLWTSNNTGGAICLSLTDGAVLWTNERAGTTGGFQYPVGQRVIRGVLYSERGPILDMKTGETIRGGPDIGDMLRRGHHVRCFPGKATERYIIAPMRGAEFIDLMGDNHMIHDWIRGSCSHGNLPANGLFYVTPDPCVCYAGAKINGFQALAAALPVGLESAPSPDDPTRLTRGPTYGMVPVEGVPDAWSSCRSGGKRLNQSPSPLSADLESAWTVDLSGELTEATIASGRCYLALRDRYELLCLDLKSGNTIWRRSFPAGLNGPPTVVGECLITGCRSGEIYALNAANGTSVWTYRAAPLERLTLADDRLENTWPVDSSVLYQNGLIYALAGRNSQLDGGLRLVALDPATGEVKHHHVFDGPRPTREQLREAVVSEPRGAEMSPELAATIRNQYATGYSIPGGNADLLVGDGRDIYLTQNRFSADLQPIPLKRAGMIGIVPMGGMHMMAQHGFADDSMFHRGFQLYDDHWTTKAGAHGSSARGGTVVAVGKAHAYASKHYKLDWYPQHVSGEGDRIVCDPFTTKNERADRLSKELGKELGFYNNASGFVRTKKPRWDITLPIIVRSLLVAPNDAAGELVLAAGIVEGDNKEDWARAGQLQSQAKLFVLDGTDGRTLAEYDLPACPVFDGMSAAEGCLLIPLTDGQLTCLSSLSMSNRRPSQ
jgi:outer membrane protein assembly factor BamB